MQADDLDLVHTDDLIDALARRSKSVVVALVKDLDAEREQRLVVYRGGRCTALGLAEYSRHFILKEFEQPPLPGE